MCSRGKTKERGEGFKPKRLISDATPRCATLHIWHTPFALHTCCTLTLHTHCTCTHPLPAPYTPHLHSPTHYTPINCPEYPQLHTRCTPVARTPVACFSHRPLPLHTCYTHTCQITHTCSACSACCTPVMSHYTPVTPHYTPLTYSCCTPCPLHTYNTPLHPTSTPIRCSHPSSPPHPRYIY